MDSESPPYEYASLEDDSIRVFILQPAKRLSDPLEGRFIHTTTRHTYGQALTYSGVSYDAVSYCWGNLEHSLTVTCDDLGSVLRITATMDQLLRRLRKTFRSRNLWIDSLCINQNNDLEKSSQVARMGRTFGLANKVHVWLGEAAKADGIPRAFQILRGISIAASQQKAYLRLIEAEAMLNGLEHPINMLLLRPWFRRRWILQEVILARVVTVHCGEYKIPWSWFQSGCTALFNAISESFTSSICKTFHALEVLANMKVDLKDPGPLEQIWKYHASECADNRDRIFSLYGLIEYPLYPPNYVQDWITVYTNFATTCVQNHETLTLLRHVLSFGSLHSRDPGSRLPSWVPAWNKERLAKDRLPNTGVFQDHNRDRVSTMNDSQPDGNLTLCGVLAGLGDPGLPNGSSKHQNHCFIHQAHTVVEELCEIDDKREERTSTIYTTFKERRYWLMPMLFAICEAVHDTQLHFHSLDFDFAAVYSGPAYEESRFGRPPFPPSNPDQQPWDKTPYSDAYETRIRKLLGPLAHNYDELMKLAATENLSIVDSSFHARYCKRSAVDVEVNSVLKGYQATYISEGIVKMPCIVPPTYQPGDMAFRLQGVSRHSDPYQGPLVLLVRPTEDTSAPRNGRAYQIVDLCFAFNPYPWLTPNAKSELSEEEVVFV